MRRGRLDEIDVDTLRTEVNKNEAFAGEKALSELQVRSHLERLDNENKVMVTWEGGTGTVYMI